MKPSPFSRPNAAWSALLALLLAAPPASARITKSRSSASNVPGAVLEGKLWQPFYSTVFGAGFEYTSNNGITDYGVPFLIDYSFNDRLILSIEPKYLSIVSRSPDQESVSGWSDLEATLIWEFLRERRYRPALSLETGIKLPIAEHADLGEPGFDYSVGLIASKDFVYFDLDLNARYTFSGYSQRRDSLELLAAIAWHLTPRLDLLGEVSTTIPAGRRIAEPVKMTTEALVGFAWQVNKHLKFEQGVIFKERGEWEAIAAFEWSFGGD